MKRIIIILIVIIVCICIDGNATIICNDGSESKTCTDCHKGCCSGHNGCLKEDKVKDNDYIKYIGIGTGIIGTIGTASYVGYRQGRKKN